MTETQVVDIDQKCYHCGAACDSEVLTLEDKAFCCFGCKTVYEVLRENDLCEYYQLDAQAGVSLRHVQPETYSFLDTPDMRKQWLDFDSDQHAVVSFRVPAIHCISCIWLLENLHKLKKGILRSEVAFGKKSVRVEFNAAQLKLSEVAELLASLGYAPAIQLEGRKSDPTQRGRNSLITKLAVAGFCFGNIMLLSFPEYLGLDASDHVFQRLFAFLNLLLATPVVAYSGQDYFIAAAKSFRQRQINIDVPIAIGLAALFLRSAYDIVSFTGPGYFDSLSGLVFFLLIGRWFQAKTYESLAFDRDYRSYFPLAVNKKSEEGWTPAPVYELQPGDVIRIRNMEIVPVDSILTHDEAYIDYSFVTGEARPVLVKQGSLVYAGGRLVGQPVELVVEKKIEQSHLTSLWNNDIFKKSSESRYKKIIDQAARKFTWAVLALALITAVYWYVTSPGQMWLVLTSVLMVACPCALALAAPFTYGNMLRAFGRNGLYLKNADIIERMASVDSVVFDKTGTVTHGASEVRFIGDLSDQELAWVRLLTASSSHPLSTLITKSIRHHSQLTPQDFHEIPGKGIEALVAGTLVKVGSPAFVGFQGTLSGLAAHVFVSINRQVRGYFHVENSIRYEMKALVARLGQRCRAMLSGDNDNDRTRMAQLFPATTELYFSQSPHDKMNFISDLQKQGHKVMMMGDGLNDSGALKQSDVGLAVTDDTGVFTPACDGILTGA
ncbi:MAG: heavy metal translocating P-type ATPase metal-binding domain-containing protein, partial [Cyclobacteriaceae bacterium]|nr:heavy metal translocating P-type ATPase metal-binding domain-containing protein [Cyclobacteriaceae bacterium]